MAREPEDSERGRGESESDGGGEGEELSWAELSDKYTDMAMQDGALLFSKLYIHAWLQHSSSAFMKCMDANTNGRMSAVVPEEEKGHTKPYSVTASLTVGGQ